MFKKDFPCIESDCERVVGPRGAKGRCQACNQRLRRPEDLAEWVVRHYPALVLDAQVSLGSVVG